MHQPPCPNLKITTESETEIVDAYWKEYWDFDEKVGIYANQFNFSNFWCPWGSISPMAWALLLPLHKSSWLHCLSDNLKEAGGRICREIMEWCETNQGWKKNQILEGLPWKNVLFYLLLQNSMKHRSNDQMKWRMLMMISLVMMTFSKISVWYF